MCEELFPILEFDLILYGYFITKFCIGSLALVYCDFILLQFIFINLTYFIYLFIC